MRRLILITCAAAGLNACGGKKDVVENGSVAENLSFESSVANDASALEAVEAEEARLAISEAANEVEADNSTASTRAANADAGADSNSN